MVVTTPSIFNRTIGLNVLEVLYNALLGLGMIIDIDTLKCKSQYPKSIYVLVIFKILLRYAEFFIISLKYLQDNLLDPGVKLLLHLLIADKNSFLEKGGHQNMTLSEISLRIKVSTC